MKKRSSTVTFDITTPFNRCIYLCFSISSAAVAALELTENGNPAFFAGLAVVLFLLAFYTDSWRFDAEIETAEHRIGLIFFSFIRRWKFEDIQAIHATRFDRGFRKTPWIRITLEFSDGSLKCIEIAPEKKISRQIAEAKALGDLFREG